jgi:catechol 2,3-dioxygenase-like lactoylglutathione lyase family enzyme
MFPVQVDRRDGASKARKSTAMNEAPRMAFAHMGIYVVDIARMVDFYTRVLGFCVTDRALIRGVNVAFLSRDPDEHHQIVLVPGAIRPRRRRSTRSPFASSPFRSFAASTRRLVEETVASLNPTNHGGSWSVYFADPEGNRIELFVQTPWYLPPVSIPLDLTLSDEEIHRLTQDMVDATPGSMPRSLWHERTRRRMLEEGSIEQRAQAPA